MKTLEQQLVSHQFEHTASTSGSLETLAFLNHPEYIESLEKLEILENLDRLERLSGLEILEYLEQLEQLEQLDGPSRYGTKKEDSLRNPLLRGGYLRLPMSQTIAVVTLKFLLGMGRNGGTLTL